MEPSDTMEPVAAGGGLQLNTASAVWLAGALAVLIALGVALGPGHTSA